ncbi:MAG: RNA polymerase sigma factor [Gemmataceae bacterium]|nr:RNA polymerase sigma factor [Gemmataceae bacterium]
MDTTAITLPYLADAAVAELPRTDGQLLDIFLCRKDQDAFAELVHRHGAMVLGVCRRVLDDAHAAEDCFQAVFLVLMRKADTILPREMVGNWLYGVAYRTALEACKQAIRRKNLEKKKQAMPAPEPRDALWQELQPLLDQELNRLPDKYRFVIVACDLECRPRREVAAMLDVPEGTVASRLSRGRDLLAKRLRRYALTVSPGLLAMLLARHAEEVVVPPHLIQAATVGVTGTQAKVLADTVTRGFWLAKMKLAVAVALIVAILCVGVATLVPIAFAERENVGKPAIVTGEKPVHLRDCVIQSIDWTNRVVRLVSLGESSAAPPIDVRIDEDTVVLIDGEKRGFADLQPGMSINLDLHRQKGDIDRAMRIETVGAWSPGYVSAVDGDSITVRVGDKTVNVKPGVSLFIDGKKAKPGDIKVKMRVELQVSPKKNTVQVIKAMGPKITGVLKSIDSKQGTLAVGTDAHRLADELHVVHDGKHAKLVDLPMGSRVAVQLSADRADSRVVGVTTLRE